MTDWLTQSKRAAELAKGKGQKGPKPLHYEREQLSKQESAVQAETPPPAPVSAAATTPAAKARKLSFKEQRELDGLPDLIARLEAEQSDAAALLADGSLYAVDNARALKLAARSAQIDDELLAAMDRWESLGSGTA